MSSQFNLTIGSIGYSVVELEGTEGYSQPFNFELKVLVDPAIDAVELLDLPACLMLDNQTTSAREVAGQIVHANTVGQHPDGSQVIALTLQPRWHYLEQQHGSSWI